ncbi:MAG: hypothetical protein RL839_09185 [Gammaproteobacteria bacterium]
MRNYLFSKTTLRCITLTILIAAHNPAWAQSEETTAKVTSEAEAHMNLYYDLFSDRNMQALPEQVFTIPWMTFGNNGMNVYTSRDEALVSWQGSLISLLQRGWDHSEYTVENVCVLNEGAAIVSGYNTRYAEDGSEMSVGGVVYFLARDDSGWRITGYTGVERGKLVTC